jgi:hypothetical protein
VQPSLLISQGIAARVMKALLNIQLLHRFAYPLVSGVNMVPIVGNKVTNNELLLIALD